MVEKVADLLQTVTLVVLVVVEEDITQLLRGRELLVHQDKVIMVVVLLHMQE